MNAPSNTLPGALVLSLDFELHWGVRDHAPAEGPYREHLIGAHTGVERTLDLLAAYDVAATWATVGFLFARSRDELEAASPMLRPAYTDARLDPYSEPIGLDEGSDPLHYAPSLIERIGQTPRQEIGTHTFSHYYCGEPGASPLSFEADLRAAQQIAERTGQPLRSIVFPRNQSGPAYVRVLPAVGIDVYRGNPPGRLWHVEEGAEGRRITRRVGRLLDTYLPVDGDDTVGWETVPEPYGLANVRASRFLRPYDPRLAALEPLRLRRITQSLTRAARQRRIYHLWWHPHNFGMNLDANLGVLRRILDTFADLREREGMLSLSMAEVADLARSASTKAVS